MKHPPLPEEYAKAIIEGLEGLDVTLILEPGRVIVGNAGILLTEVQYIKETETKKFVIVDGGMNDLIRPALYGSYQAIQPVVESRGRKRSSPTSSVRSARAAIFSPRIAKSRGPSAAICWRS